MATAALTERYAANLQGVLSCFDRIIITGTLPGACYADGMTSFLYARKIKIFDYPRLAEPLREGIRERAQEICAAAGVEIEHVSKSHVRKEKLVARSAKPGATLGADKAYDVAEFVQALRKQGITPHVAQKKVGRAIDGRTTRHPGYAVSIKKRKLVAETFGWTKTVGGLRKARFIGLAKVKAQTVFTLAAYNLTRMATIFGWRLNSA
jgi:hypothetical protein